MKISIDARIFWKTHKKFFLEFLSKFKQKNPNDTIKVYSKIEDIEDIDFVENSNYNSLFWEQSIFFKQLLNDKHNIFITFEQTYPILHKSRTFQIITSLENILYPDLEHSKFLKKYSQMLAIKSSLKKSYKIICFSSQTKKEINEKLNISEEKIEVISPFFEISKPSESKVDIKTKHCLTWDYIIYDSEPGNNKNIKRFLESVVEVNKEEKLNIIFIGNNISSDIETRELVIKLWLKDNVIFAWEPNENELWVYYTQSIWVIYPTIYDSFPFSLKNALSYNTPIISSELDEVINIFWNKINYFSPISVTSIKNEIKKLLKNKKNPDYSEILKKYSSEKFVDNLTSLIK